MDWIRIIYDFWAERPSAFVLLFTMTVIIVYIMLPDRLEKRFSRLEERCMMHVVDISFLDDDVRMLSQKLDAHISQDRKEVSHKKDKDNMKGKKKHGKRRKGNH